MLLAGRAYGADWACTAAEPNCKPAFIVHSSWHAAIVLRKNDIPPDVVPELVDFPRAEFIEFSWGDEDYFPNPQAGFFTALKAAFWSSGSVMHVVGFAGKVADFYPGATVIEFNLSAPAYARLLDYISETFSRDAAGRPASPNAGLFAYSRFYPATRKFSLLKTCNAWVAEALQSAGLPIAPAYVITAGQLSDQIGKVGEQP
jgi:uncharacterized protein (TIGR02117 family)